MDNKKPQFEISDPYLESMKIVGDQLSEIKKFFNWAITFIVGVLMIGFVTLLFMVAGMVVDAWRFNSSIYKESQQFKLQEEYNKNIIEQQKMIIENLQIMNNKIKK